MVSEITVRKRGASEPLTFDVSVKEPDGETQHRITLSRADRERLGARMEPETLVHAAFRFLLDREPKESILARFDLSVIQRYFPEFETELASYLPS
jgi:hypothetical protein